MSETDLNRHVLPMRALFTMSILSLLPLIQLAVGQTSNEAVNVLDLLRLKTIDNVAVAPGGRMVAFTVRSVASDSSSGESAHAYRAQLYLASAMGGGARQITFHDDGADHASWHPEGNRIAFVRPVQGTSQIFELRLDGGEPRQITRFPYGASEPVWSPDGQKILFASHLSRKEVASLYGSSDPGERPDPVGTLESVRAWLDENAAEGKPRVLRYVDGVQESEIAPIRGHRHLFIIDLEDPSAEPQAVTRGFGSFEGGGWVPSGLQLVASGYVAERDEPWEPGARGVFLIDLERDRIHRLIDLEGWIPYSPRISPDGMTVAFLADSVNQEGAVRTELATYALDGRSEPEWLTLDLVEPASSPQWSPDGWFLYFASESAGRFRLHRIALFEGDAEERPLPEDTEPVDGLPGDTTVVAESDTLDLAFDLVELGTLSAEELEFSGSTPSRTHIDPLTRADLSIGSFSVGMATIFYSGSDAANPSELYASNLPFTQERLLSSINEDWLATKHIAAPIPIRMLDEPAPEVRAIPPLSRRDGTRHPLVVVLRGRPADGRGQDGASYWHGEQFLASQGYGVLATTHRGHPCLPESGNGARQDTTDLNLRPDGRAAVDHVALPEWADTTRLFLIAESGAVCLRAWFSAGERRFLAAVVEDGTLRDLPAADDTVRAYPLEGWPPLLIIENEVGHGVVPGHGAALFGMMSHWGHPVEYVRYPALSSISTEARDLTQSIDRLLRIHEFFARSADPP